jgi:hypothetical protein
MSRRRAVLAVLAVLVSLLTVTVVVTSIGGSGPPAVLSSPPLAAPPFPVPAPVPSSASPKPSTVDTPAPAVSAAPFVQHFGDATATPQPPQPSPTAPAVVSVNIDGCDHTYGAPTQCVPYQFPPGVTDGCAWLTAHGFGPLAVHGADRLGLDSNHDNVACGAGDG